MPERNRSEGFVPTLEAAAATAQMLAEAGLSFCPDDDDIDAAATLVKGVARDPERLQFAAASHELTKHTPAALLLTRQILKDYGHKIVQEAETVRHLVMNKLVQETENPDPRVRIRALELLGKMGDVGLFTERKEVVVTHQTSDDVRERLRARLARLLPQEDAEIVDVTPAQLEPPAEPAEPAAPVEPEIYELSLEPKRAAASLFDE